MSGGAPGPGAGGLSLTGPDGGHLCPHPGGGRLPAESSARTRALEQLLYHVGRWIYLVDAWDDLEEDGRTGSYNPIAARFPEQVEANRDYLRTTLLHSLNLARSACALLELGHWQGAVENILYLGLPMVEELVFTGRWKAVNHQNRRRIS